jgi:hypothetical protein
MAGDENDPVQNTLVSTFAQALANLGWTLIYLVLEPDVSSTRRHHHPAHNRNRLGRNCPGSAGSMEASQAGSAPIVICNDLTKAHEVFS